MCFVTKRGGKQWIEISLLLWYTAMIQCKRYTLLLNLVVFQILLIRSLSAFLLHQFSSCPFFFVLLCVCVDKSFPNRFHKYNLCFIVGSSDFDVQNQYNNKSIYLWKTLPLFTTIFSKWQSFTNNHNATYIYHLSHQNVKIQTNKSTGSFVTL